MKGMKRTILEDLLAELSGDAPVRSLLVGAHWTVVCSRFCGLASTVLEEKPHDHARARVQDAGCLHLKSARELAEYARSVLTEGRNTRELQAMLLQPVFFFL
jgi:hypothetical protein